MFYEVLLVALTLVCGGDGFKCYNCVYMDGKSEDTAAKGWVHDAITQMGGLDKLCKDTFGTSARQKTQQECGRLPEGGDFWGCAKTKVSAHLDYQGSTVSLTATKRNCIPLIHNHTYSTDDCHGAAQTDNPFSGHAVHSLYLGSDDVIQNGDICVCHSQLCNQAAPPTSGSWLMVCFSVLSMVKFV